MEYKQIIRCGVKEETILEIGKFSILWNMLEERYFDKCMTDKKVPDVANFIYSDNIQQYCLNLVHALLKYLNEDKKTITIEKIRKKLYSESWNGSYSEMERTILGKSNNVELLIGSMLLLLRLRNNLFHGEKDTYKINAQLELFSAANTLLDKLLGD